jgi:hypothetical protein
MVQTNTAKLNPIRIMVKKNRGFRCCLSRIKPKKVDAQEKNHDDLTHPNPKIHHKIIDH